MRHAQHRSSDDRPRRPPPPQYSNRGRPSARATLLSALQILEPVHEDPNPDVPERAGEIYLARFRLTLAYINTVRRLILLAQCIVALLLVAFALVVLAGSVHFVFDGSATWSLRLSPQTTVPAVVVALGVGVFRHRRRRATRSRPAAQESDTQEEVSLAI